MKTHFNYLIPKTAGTIFLLVLLLVFAGHSYGATEKIPEAEQLVAAELPSPLLAHARSLAAAQPETNYVRILDIGEEALLARVHLIRSARKSIAIQTIIWVNDEVGRLMMYELIGAAKRGVKVQLLIDHFASEQHAEIATFLAAVHPNLEVKLYNPVNASSNPTQAKAAPSLLEKLQALFTGFDRFNQRMHNKTFIIDDLIGITGGRNYQNAYFDQARGMNYKDRDILVIGPAVHEMKESFQAFWDFKYSVNLDKLKDVRKNLKEGKVTIWATRDSFELHGLFDELDAQAGQDDLISELFVKPLLAVDQAYFIADEPGKNIRTSLGTFKGEGRITLELAKLALEAQESLYIQTPYLVLTGPAIDLFKDIREKHPEIDIRISTNSLAATDSWYVYALSYKQKQTYLQELQFKITELKPLPGDMHVLMPTYEQLRSRPLTPSEQEKIAAKLAATRENAGSGERSGYDPATLERPPQPGEPYFCLHAKSMVVDDAMAFIGSYNLDPRSENINTEVGLVIRDRRVAGLLKENIMQDMKPQNSWIVAKKKMALGLNHPNAVIAKFSDLFPVVDPWPVRYSASFELIDGKEPVDIDHADFYENFRDVGSFPHVNESAPGKELGARGTKAFLSFVKPLL